MNSSCVAWDSGNLLEAGMGDDDGIPVARGDAAHQGLALLLLEILLGGHEDVRAGIERQQFGGELAEHVVGHGEQGLPGQAQAFQLHRCRDHGVGLAGADDVCEQAIGGLQDAPDGGALVRVQNDGGAGARQPEMVAVEGAEADVVELVVVCAREALAALIVLPDPLLEPFLDFLLLVARRFGRGTVDHIAVGVRVMIINGGGAQVEGVFEQFDRTATVGAPLGGVCDAVADAVIALDYPEAKLRRMTDGDALLAEQIVRELADVIGGNPGAAQTGVYFGSGQVDGLNQLERLDVGLELVIRQGGGLGDLQLGADVPG